MSARGSGGCIIYLYLDAAIALTFPVTIEPAVKSNWDTGQKPIQTSTYPWNSPKPYKTNMHLKKESGIVLEIIVPHLPGEGC